MGDIECMACPREILLWHLRLKVVPLRDREHLFVDIGLINELYLLGMRLRVFHEGGGFRFDMVDGKNGVPVVVRGEELLSWSKVVGAFVKTGKPVTVPPLADAVDWLHCFVVPVMTAAVRGAAAPLQKGETDIPY